eukprot:3213710-Rhodomonas_salina.2
MAPLDLLHFGSRVSVVEPKLDLLTAHATVAGPILGFAALLIIQGVGTRYEEGAGVDAAAWPSVQFHDNAGGAVVTSRACTTV